ncbi:ABC transporter permease [Marinilactibacillus piezotolerans]|uniref:ABC transporter permease n=1 Tax=Marinilactibacillus piezotolerans TaxID=258723 RepID=UPI0009AFC440|nr:branched-chain amino acid ABC transporter permease [Marinilactibacillus piezotolerans]
MIISAIADGLIWAVLGIGLYLTYRILKFPDLTTEGSFPLGSAVAVTAIVSGVSPILSMGLAVLAGMGAGLVTGLLYTKGKVPVILAGILVMTGLHSVILFIMQRPNLSLLNHDRIYYFFQGLPDYYDVVFTGMIVLALLIILLLGFFYTRLGQAFIATGDNEEMARSLGIHTDKMKILGLMISNGIIALAGSLVAQELGYADVNGGTGVIVIGLASLIIGEVLFGNLKLGQRLGAVVIGSILYQLLLLGVIQLGLDTTYIRIYSSVILAICLMIPQIRRSLNLGTLIGKGEKA